MYRYVPVCAPNHSFSKHFRHPGAELQRAFLQGPVMEPDVLEPKNSVASSPGEGELPLTKPYIEKRRTALFDVVRYRTLQVEVTTACNLDCAICLRRKLKRPNRFLSFSDFTRILDPGLFRYVGLHGWGEPLLNEHIFKMIHYARSQGVMTNLTTNGTLLAEKGDEIIKSGLDEIAIGIYDPDLLSRVLSDIEEFIRKRREKGLKTP